MVWINILSVILAPIIAVWVGQKLQDRAEKRKDIKTGDSFVCHKSWNGVII